MRRGPSGARRLREVAATLCLAAFALVMCQYSAHGERLRLEGNDLYSSSAVEVSMPPVEAAAMVKRLGGENRALMRASQDPRVRWVVVGNASEVSFPVSAGRSFTRSDRRAALVGSEYAPMKASGLPRRLGSAELPVVGTLGAAGDSLVGDEALVLDDSAFATTAPATLVLDGPDVRQAALGRVGPARVRPVDKGMAARTDVDLITPLIIRAGGLALLVALLTNGILMGGARLKVARVLCLMGHTRGQAMGWVVRDSAVTVLAAAAVCAPVWALHAADARPSLRAIAVALCVALLVPVVTALHGRPWDKPC